MITSSLVFFTGFLYCPEKFINNLQTQIKYSIQELKISNFIQIQDILIIPAYLANKILDLNNQEQIEKQMAF